jgi:hypothetical protein
VGVWSRNGRWYYEYKWAGTRYSGNLEYRGMDKEEARQELEGMREAKRLSTPKTGMAQVPRQPKSEKIEGVVLSFSFSEQAFASLLDSGVHSVMLRLVKDREEEA